MRQAVVFGAGSVGRGFIAPLLSHAGWGVTFLDVAPRLVEALAADGRYGLVTVGNAVETREVIRPVGAVNARDSRAAVEVIASADAAATCVGARFLPDVADTLAKALARRIELGRPPLDVLLAENLHNAAAVMRGLLRERLTGVDAAVLDAQVGLMETSIGRMIPVPDPARLVDQPTAVFVEPYSFLPYDAAAGHGVLRNVPGLVADDSVPFAFYGDRKLYVHNMGHCFAAYLGDLVGSETIPEAIGNPGVRYLVRAAMVESAVALAWRYQVAMPRLLAHVDDLLHRFGNRALSDTVERVGRDAERKMAAGDRLLGAFAAAVEAGLPGHHLSLAVAAGAVQLRLRTGWDDHRVWSHLSEGLPDGVLAARRGLLEAQISGLMGGFDFQQQIELVGTAYEPSHVI